MTPDDLEKRIKEIEQRCEKASVNPMPEDWNDGDTCQVCDSSVLVRENCDWEDDPICDTCLGDFARDCRIDIPFLLDQLEKYKQEIALCRERLGPAGYKILQDLKRHKRAVDLAREALKEHHRNIMECGVYDDALTEIDKILGEEI